MAGTTGVEGRPPRALQTRTKKTVVTVVQTQAPDQSEAGLRLTFVGKDNAREIARRVRPRVMVALAKYAVGSNAEQAQNLVVEGDNLQSMVTLYRERGQVDLILADPPYNTGNDFRYNDKWDDDPNDPGMGEFVTSDDGARHTKWMRFMWPRLQMMKAMLRPSGVLAICIDHRELFHLGQMLDELFGENNRLAIINWQKSAAGRPDNTHVSTSTEYVLVYGRDVAKARTASLERIEADNSRYSNPDDDPDGLWREGNLTARTWVQRDDYGIQSPFTGELHYPAGDGAWRHPRRNIKDWLEEWGSPYEERKLNDDHPPAVVIKSGFSEQSSVRARKRLVEPNWPFIWFGRDGLGRPRTKTYLEKIKKGKVAVTYWADEEYLLPSELGSVSWDYEESGRSSDGVSELISILGSAHGFNTVKPLKLMMKVIQLWCPSDGLVLDPFAGSGTSGHAVIQMNATAGTNRRFILIEQGRPERGDSYARSLLAERLGRAITGKWAAAAVEPLQAGFRFVALKNKVDADAVLHMEREEMIDAVIGSYFDQSKRRGSSLIYVDQKDYHYLVAKNSEDEGFFLVWDGPAKNTDFNDVVYEAVAREAKKAGLKPSYHIYARFNLYQTDNVRFYQIPDRILADFGLDIRSEPFHDLDE